jgi:hypothetical protein
MAMCPLYRGVYISEVSIFQGCPLWGAPLYLFQYVSSTLYVNGLMTQGFSSHVAGRLASSYSPARCLNPNKAMFLCALTFSLPLTMAQNIAMADSISQRNHGTLFSVTQIADSWKVSFKGAEVRWHKGTCVVWKLRVWLGRALVVVSVACRAVRVWTYA